MPTLSAADALEQYIFSLTGETITEGDSSFNIYNNPPADETGNYIWWAITTLGDRGPRESFLQDLIAEFTVVAPEDVNRNSKETMYLGVRAIMDLFSGRGLQVNFTLDDGDQVTIMSQQLQDTSDGAESIGQKKLIFAKVNIRFTVSF